MKIVVISFVLIFCSIKLIAQTDSAEDHIANSYKQTYDKRFPELKYSYDQPTQTHNYSGNWDFDGDGKPDSLYFIGNGGAHLYFHLQIVLSSDHKKRDFPWLLSDFPMLDSAEYLKRIHKKSSYFPLFVVDDFNNDGKPDIYFNTDTHFAPIPAKWQKRGVNSRQVLICYEKKEIVIRNFRGL